MGDLTYIKPCLHKWYGNIKSNTTRSWLYLHVPALPIFNPLFDWSSVEQYHLHVFIFVWGTQLCCVCSVTCIRINEQHCVHLTCPPSTQMPLHDALTLEGPVWFLAHLWMWNRQRFPFKRRLISIGCGTIATSNTWSFWHMHWTRCSAGGVTVRIGPNSDREDVMW